MAEPGNILRCTIYSVIRSQYLVPRTCTMMTRQLSNQDVTPDPRVTRSSLSVIRSQRHE